MLFAFLIYAAIFALVYFKWARFAMDRYPLFEDTLHAFVAAGVSFGALLGILGIGEAFGVSLDGGGGAAMTAMGLVFLFAIFMAMGLLAGVVLGVDALIRYVRLRPAARTEERR